MLETINLDRKSDKNMIWDFFKKIALFFKKRSDVTMWKNISTEDDLEDLKRVLTIAK